MAKDVERDVVFKVIFTLAFAGKNSLQEYQAPEISGKVYSEEDLPLKDEDQVRELLKKLHQHDSVGPNGIHTRTLRALGTVTTRALAICF